MEVKEYAGPLRAVVEKGQYESLVKVAGDEVLMHVAKVHEEQAINTATAGVNLLDREYERWVHRLARVVTRVNGSVFPSVDEALAFMRNLSQPHFEGYVEEYSKLVSDIRLKLAQKVVEVKN